MEKGKCFVIMPISDIDGYDKGHFCNVYNSLIKPAIEKAGYQPERADEIKSSNLIAVDIIERICSTPIAICDISACNPNVFYELGIRHAMKLPVVLIKDCKTNNPFDIKDIRYIEYSEKMSYMEVIEKQDEISLTLNRTIDDYVKGRSKNSIFHILNFESNANKNRTGLESNSMEKEANEILQMIENKKHDYLFSLELEKLIFEFGLSYSQEVKGRYYNDLLKSKYKQYFSNPLLLK